MIRTIIRMKNRLIIGLLTIGLMVFFFPMDSFAQEQPPRPIAVYVSPIQGLSFGDIILGPTGGTVTVSPTGSRSSTGSIILGDFGGSFTPALFEIEANPGTLISILNGPNVILNGSGGGTLTLVVGNSDPASPFICTLSYPSRNQIRIGGTLQVGNTASNPPGNYSGTFSLTFIQE
jgi:hypothetical protein